MHEDTYLDDLYCMQDMLKEDFKKFVKDAGAAKLDKGRLEYGDALMHFAKNLRKELFAEEGMDEEEMEGFSGGGGTQTFGRAIRTTPGMWEDGGDSSGSRSMRGGSYRSMRSMRQNGGSGNSGRRDSRGRFTSRSGNRSGHGDSGDAISRLQEMADMTTNHDEREIMLNMIERLKQDSE